MKKLLTLVLCLVLITGFVFAEDYQTQANNKLYETVEPLAGPIVSVLDTYTVPMAVQHNVWADAYIGKLFPSVIPHLGVGASVSAMMIPAGISGMSDLLPPVVTKIIGEGTLPLPAPTINARVGGLFLPFDIGVSYMDLEMADLMGSGFSINYKTYSGDIRYAILKQNLILPNISIGVGYTGTEGSIGMSVSENDVTGNAGITFKANVYTASAQISKSILMLTPYAGARFSLSESEYSWYADANTTVNSENYAAKAGKTITNTLGQQQDIQFFAGLNLRLLVIDNTFGVTYDLTTNSFGGSLSIRASL